MADLLRAAPARRRRDRLTFIAVVKDGTGRTITNLAAGDFHHGGEVDAATGHGDVRRIQGPDLVAARDRELAQQVRIDLVARRRLAAARLRAQRLDAHALHQRGHGPAADLQAFAPELIAHHPCAHERVLQGELVQPPPQPQVALADRARQVVHRAAADTEQLGLARDAQVMGTVDHRFALSNPALVSARSKKSFSSVSSPIWACSGPRSTGGAASELPPNAPEAFSTSWRRHSVIWLGCTSNCLASSAIVFVLPQRGQGDMRLERRGVRAAGAPRRLLRSHRKLLRPTLPEPASCPGFPPKALFRFPAPLLLPPVRRLKTFLEPSYKGSICHSLIRGLSAQTSKCPSHRRDQVCAKLAQHRQSLWSARPRVSHKVG